MSEPTTQPSQETVDIVNMLTDGCYPDPKTARAQKTAFVESIIAPLRERPETIEKHIHDICDENNAEAYEESVVPGDQMATLELTALERLDGLVSTLRERAERAEARAENAELALGTLTQNGNPCGLRDEALLICKRILEENRVLRRKPCAHTPKAIELRVRAEKAKPTNSFHGWKNWQIVIAVAVVWELTQRPAQKLVDLTMYVWSLL